MDTTILWIIIIAFYAPLHFGLPQAVIVLTQDKELSELKPEMKRALRDSILSLIAGFVIAIALVSYDHMSWAMMILFLSMPVPIIRYFLNK